MTTRAAWLEKALDELEALMFPHQESEEEQEALTDVGRDRIATFLRPLDETAFNAGFDAAIRAVLPPAALKTINFTHPKYFCDRRAEYDKFRTESA